MFLDEVPEMSPSVQAKFLHFLQHREFERLGETKKILVDVRVIAATNKDLEELVRDNMFRQDLFFRLNVIELYMLPLRDRPDDIQLIAKHYLNKFARNNDKTINKITEEALQILRSYPWSGNVRELINVIERGTILSHHDQLTRK